MAGAGLSVEEVEEWERGPGEGGWSTAKAAQIALSASSTLEEMAAASVVLAHFYYANMAGTRQKGPGT